MRKLHLSVLTIALSMFFAACSSEDATPTCGTVTGLTLTQNADKIAFAITGDNAMAYEVSGVANGLNLGPGEGGNIKSFNSPNGELLTGEFGGQDYMVYARTVCSDNVKGEWFGPVAFNPEPYCGTPTDLHMELYDFVWTNNSSAFGAEPYANFQVEYGPQGFQHGTGTLATVTNNRYTGFSLAEGQLYDFYVRGYCTNNAGYGNWAGPFSHYSENNLNMCSTPNNLRYEVTGNNGSSASVSFKWNLNGEDSFEYTIVQKNQPILESGIHTYHSPFSSGTGTVSYSLSMNIDFDFYVRAVCSNGNKTPWAKKQFSYD